MLEGHDVTATSSTDLDKDVQKYNTTQGPNAASKTPRPNRAIKRLLKSFANDYSMVTKVSVV